MSPWVFKDGKNVEVGYDGKPVKKNNKKIPKKKLERIVKDVEENDVAGFKEMGEILIEDEPRLQSVTRHNWKIPDELHEIYKKKWTELYGERGRVGLLESLVKYFDKL